MRVDMCVDMCLDLCLDLCLDSCLGLCLDLFSDLSLDLRGVRVDMRSVSTEHQDRNAAAPEACAGAGVRACACIHVVRGDVQLCARRRPSPLWINDAGYRSHYCGSTMLATVHIIVD